MNGRRDHAPDGCASTVRRGFQFSALNYIAPLIYNNKISVYTVVRDKLNAFYYCINNIPVPRSGFF